MGHRGIWPLLWSLVLLFCHSPFPFWAFLYRYQTGQGEHGRPCKAFLRVLSGVVVPCSFPQNTIVMMIMGGGKYRPAPPSLKSHCTVLCSWQITVATPKEVVDHEQDKGQIDREEQPQKQKKKRDKGEKGQVPPPGI